MKQFPFALVCGLCLASCCVSYVAGQATSSEAEEDTSSQLKLEDLFPEKSMFGPSASDVRFSPDGRFAAYLYRGYDKRRHGNELWVYDFDSGESRQLTNLEMMAQFQRSAREVNKDRLAKRKKAKQADEEGANDSETDDSQESAEEDDSTDADTTDDEEEIEFIETVDEKDADDEDAPRYSGISSFQWHPTEHKLLLTSEGDLYLMDNLDEPVLSRLTKTTAGESRADFDADGQGIIFSQGDTIYRLAEDSRVLEQINPRLPSGMNLTNHEISPDGKRLVMVARSGERFSGSRTVDIIRYRDRFAKSDSVRRTVSDDEVKPQQVKVFLFDLDQADEEQSPLIEVFSETIDEPRDIISTPKWSLDSEQITFCFYNQKDDEVQIRHARFPDSDELATGKQNKSNEKAEDGEPGNGRSRNSSAPQVLQFDSTVPYRFKHYGGPNTPRMVSPDFAADNKHIVFVSEQSGFRHVHLLDPLYESVRQLTNGHFEVYPMRFSDDHKFLFVTATKESAARSMVYALEIESGELRSLSTEPGNYSSADVSNDGQRFAANFVTYGKLRELIVQESGGELKTLTDSHPEKAKELTSAEPEFFEFENRHGHSISGMMFKPDDWEAVSANAEENGGKYPLLIYVYGGPLGTRHSVSDGSYSSDGYFFQMYMAKKHGYLTIVVDPRGQSGYGGVFEKANYEQVGKPQVEDLVDGVEHMISNYGVDPKRVALYGWSFGGFQTQMCMYTEPRRLSGWHRRRRSDAMGKL